MSVVSDLVAIQRAHHAQLLRIRDLAAALIEGAWDGFAGLDDASAARFVDAAVEISTATKYQTTDLAYGYMAANDQAAGYVADLVPELPTIRGGADPAKVYHRSIVEARQLVANGTALQDALSAGRARATSTARTDVVLTNKTAISNGATGRPWVVGYRRTLTGKSCGLCATASTQRYRRADLQPIHGNCDCDTAEIFGNADPGRVINRELLDDLKSEGVIDDISQQRQVRELRKTKERQEARLEELRKEFEAEQDQERETRLERRMESQRRKIDATGRRIDDAQARRTARVSAGDSLPSQYLVDESGNIITRSGTVVKSATRTHGELGPVLTNAGHEFTGPTDLP